MTLQLICLAENCTGSFLLPGGVRQGQSTLHIQGHFPNSNQRMRHQVISVLSPFSAALGHLKEYCMLGAGPELG